MWIKTKNVNKARACAEGTVTYLKNNPGKKSVDFLNLQTLSPSPLIECWYLGDMCCKSTLPEPTLFRGGGGGGGGNLR